jgi:hypothetical protein
MSAHPNLSSHAGREFSPSPRARRALEAARPGTLRSVGRRIFSLLAVLPILVIIVLLREAGGL